MSSASENPRYSRHYSLPEIGKSGQKKLSEASVLIVGAGGLGCPCIQYLTAAGVGKIGIVDDDRIEESNLQRQVIYRNDDIGKLKAETAASYAKAQNPEIEIKVHPLRLDNKNGPEIVTKYDIIVDATDNFSARYSINDICEKLGKPYVYGSVFRFEGQVSVFNVFLKGDNSPPVQYRDLYPAPPPPHLSPDCADAGVMGALTGIIGSIQAMEVIKVITGAGIPLTRRVLILDGLSMTTNVIKIKSSPKKVKPNAETSDTEKLTEITPKTLKKWMDSGKNFDLIDIREPAEHEQENIGGRLVPPAFYEKIPSMLSDSKPAVLYCKSGIRSGHIIRLLQKEHGLKNLIQLTGGLDEWNRSVK